VSELRVGVVGVGKMGLLHAGIFNQLESSALVAVAEKDGLTSNLLKAYLPHIRVYSDYEKMFKREELDIAVITTPVFLHKPIVEVAREHDCHVFVEKPWHSTAMNAGRCCTWGTTLRRRWGTTGDSWRRLRWPSELSTIPRLGSLNFSSRRCLKRRS